MAAQVAPKALVRLSETGCRSRRRRQMQQQIAPAASDRLVPKRNARRSAAWQRPRPDAENFGGEVSLLPPSRVTSFDHLVGAGEQRRRNIDAERLGCVEIDQQLEPGWLFDRQVCGLRTLENLVYV